MSISPEDQAFIADFCAAIVPCCQKNKVTVDNAICKQSMTKVALTNDPQVRAACVQQIRDLSTTAACMPDVADLGGPCARIFNEPSGPSAPGEMCKTARDCTGSPGTVTYCFGTCITYGLGAAGDYPCLGNENTVGFINSIPWKNGSTTPESHGFICQQRAGLYCDWNDNTCKPIVGGGAACPTGDSAAAACESATCEANVCIALPQAGETCTLDCKGDNDCFNGVCTPRLPAAAACVVSDQCSGVCAGSDRCTGTCVDGACSPLTVAQGLVLGTWCGQVPVND